MHPVTIGLAGGEARSAPWRLWREPARKAAFSPQWVLRLQRPNATALPASDAVGRRRARFRVSRAAPGAALGAAGGRR